MSSSIDSVSRYLKLKARADHPATPKTEKAIAKKFMLRMCESDPGLPRIAKRVAGVIDGQAPAAGAPTGGGPSTWWQDMEVFLGGIAMAAAERGADNFAGEVTGSARYEPIRRNQVIFKPHDCSPNQVCLEIRVRAIDVERVSFREQLLDGIEDELLEMIEEG